MITNNRTESGELVSRAKVRKALAQMQSDIDALPGADATERWLIVARMLVRQQKIVRLLIREYN